MSVQHRCKAGTALRVRFHISRGHRLPLVVQPARARNEDSDCCITWAQLSRALSPAAQPAKPDGCTISGTFFELEEAGSMNVPPSLGTACLQTCVQHKCADT